MASKNKQECKEQFLEHFKMTEEDLSVIWRWFLEYGMTRGQNENKPHQCRANHYFLQEISERFTVNWKEWNKKLSPELKILVINLYPQLMVKNYDFEWL
ncbi:hypothetical protein DRF62_02155 [Chryseobacterium piscium]|uniref:Uncharacterized protein n=1 Tax=Chryseobacterium piscium TaxID=333702 RepID=A0A3D9BTY3_9FLAO|nr:hypothetical protein [Chryseobacterium piscium]REC56983.1 hypothetical protein DRF62_02155 [Chryseobacterium piscium]